MGLKHQVEVSTGSIHQYNISLLIVIFHMLQPHKKQRDIVLSLA